MKSVLTLCALAAVVLLMACGGTPATANTVAGSASTQRPTPTATSAPTATTLAPDLHGYLATDANSVIFIEWTDDHGTLAGTIQLAMAQSADTDNLATQRASLTGVRAGDRVTLTIPQGLGFATALSGTVSGDTLTLFYPDAQGVMTPTTFRAATLTDYNRAVIALQQRAAQAQAAQATADARQQAAQATADAQQRSAQATADAQDQQQEAVRAANVAVAHTLDLLSSDTANLTDNAKFDDVTQDYGDKWTKMQADYQQMRGDAAVRPFTCTQLGQVQADVGQLASDNGGIEAARGLFESRKSLVATDIVRVQDDSRGVQAAFSALQAAVVANTTGSPAAQFGPADVNKAIDAANEAIDAATKMLQQTQGQADTVDGQATRLLKSAQDSAASLTCMVFVVTGTGGEGLGLRDAPGGIVVTTLPDGTRLEQIGPDRQDSSGTTWHNVRTPDGTTGWVSARYTRDAP